VAATITAPEAIHATVVALEPALERLARIDAEIVEAARGTEGSGVLTVVGEQGLVAILEPGRDPAALARERGRLEKELAEAERLLAAARARLADAAFTAKAPPVVVDGARSREVELADRVARLRERLVS
jgi:valyl-tRNA synthetase